MFRRVFHDFGDKESEIAFSKAYASGVPAHLLCLGATSLLLTCFAVVTQANTYKSLPAHEKARVGIAVMIFGLWLLVFPMLLLKRFTSRLLPSAQTLAGSAITITCCLIPLWSNFRLATLMYGAHRHNVMRSLELEPQKESVLILSFLFMIVGVNIFVSLRLRWLLIVNMLTTLWFSIALFSIGSTMSSRELWRSMLFVYCIVVFTSYASWRNEMQLRDKWKDVRRAENEVSKAEARTQAMHGLISMVCEIDFVANDDLMLWNEAPQTNEVLGDVFGMKLRDLVAPECAETFDTLVAPLLDESSTTRTLMTPPITLQSTSPISVRSGFPSVRAIIMIVDTCEMHQAGDFTWRYLVGMKDLQYVGAQENTLEVPAEAQECPTMSDDLHEQEQNVNTTDTQTETGTTLTSRMFADLKRSQQRDDMGIQGRDPWQALVALGKKEHWLIPAQDITDDPSAGLLGRGGFGSVHAGLLHGSPIAVKAPHGADNARILKATNTLANELRILRHLRHPYVVMWFGACIDPNQMKFALIFERINGQCLFSCLGSKTLDDHADGRLWILENIACALCYLHAQKPTIVHGDLKDSNIMVEQWAERPRARLLDFGLSLIVEPRSSLLGTSWRWAAPECFLRPEQVQPSSDVFSFGRLLHRVLTGQLPLAGIHKQFTVQMFADHGMVWVPVWHKNSYLQDFVTSARLLSKKCLMVDVEARPLMKDVHTDVCMLFEQICGAQATHLLSYWHTDPVCTQRFSVSFDPFDECLHIVDCSPDLRALVGNAFTRLNLADIACNPKKLHLYVQLETQLCVKHSKMSGDTLQTELVFHFVSSMGYPMELSAVCSRDPILSQGPYMVMLMQDVQLSKPVLAERKILCL